MTKRRSSPDKRPSRPTKIVPSPRTPGQADNPPSIPTAETIPTSKPSANSGIAASRSRPTGTPYRPPTGQRRGAPVRVPPPRKPHNIRKIMVASISLILVGSLMIFFAIAVNGSVGKVDRRSTSGPEGVVLPQGPVLAAIDSSQYPRPIDGIKCETNEQLVYHIHAHISIFAYGKPAQIPAGIGIGPPLQTNQTPDGAYVQSGACFYWIHTHAADGIIHIESPTQTIFTLGQFFDLWGKILQNDQVGPAVGKLTMFVDGKPYNGDPRAIQLSAHAQIQLDIDQTIPPSSIVFPKSF